MKVIDGSYGLAKHCANREKSMVIVAIGKMPVHHGGYPAVLRDGDDWFSAELVLEGRTWVAYAVNLYGDRYTAQYDAQRRGQVFDVEA